MPHARIKVSLFGVVEIVIETMSALSGVELVNLQLTFGQVLLFGCYLAHLAGLLPR